MTEHHVRIPGLLQRLLVGVLPAVLVACSDGGAARVGDNFDEDIGDIINCFVDTDCPAGNTCFGGVCIPVNPDIETDDPGRDNDTADTSLDRDNDTADSLDLDTDGDIGDREREEITGCYGQVGLVPADLVNFGAVQLGQELCEPLRIVNVGLCPLRVIVIQTSGGTDPTELRVTDAPRGITTLGVQESIVVQVCYRPVDSGADSGTITVVSDDPTTDGVNELPWISETKGQPTLFTRPDRDEGVNFGAVEVFQNTGSNTPEPRFVDVELCNRADDPTENHVVEVTKIALRSIANSELQLADTPVATVSSPLRIPAGTCAPPFKVAYVPVSESVLTDSVLITWNARNASDNPYEIPVTGRGVAARLEVDPNPVSLGTIKVRDSRSQIVTLRNRGFTNLKIEQVSLAAGGSPDITLDPLRANGANLAPGGSTTVLVQCRPSQQQVSVRLLEVISNSYQTPYIVVPIDCTGEAATASVFPSAVDFGMVRRGGKELRPLEVCNTGRVSLIINDLRFENPAGCCFAHDQLASGIGLPLNLDPGECAYFQISFEPSNVGPARASLRVVSTDIPNLPSVNLSGTGGEPIIRIEPTALAIPDAEVGFPQTGELMVYNDGNMDLNVGELGLDGVGGVGNQFELQYSPFFRIPPGGEKRIVVKFTPAVIGEVGARFFVCSDAANAFSGVCNAPDQKRYTADVTGRGVDPQLTVTVLTRPGECTPSITQDDGGRWSIDYGTLLPGARCCANLRISNQGARQGVTTVSDMSTLAFNPDFAVGRFVSVSGVQTFKSLADLAGEGRPAVPFSLRPATPAPVQDFSVCYFAPQIQGQSYSAVAIRHNVQSLGPQYPDYQILLKAGALPNPLPIAIAKAYTTPDQNANPDVKRGTLTFNGAIDANLTLDGAASFDRSGTETCDSQGVGCPAELQCYLGACIKPPVRYLWTRENATQDDLEFVGAPNTQSLAAVCRKPGRYLVKLRVWDDQGAFSQDTPDSQVTVNCQACPQAQAVEVTSRLDDIQIDLGENGAVVNFTGALSSDTDGRVVYYIWRVFRPFQQTPVAQAEGPTPTWSYTFNEGGQFLVTLQVRDNDGNLSCNTGQVQVFVGYNDKLSKVEVTWDGGGRVETSYVCPGCTIGTRGDCRRDNPTPNWETLGSGFGRPRFLREGAGDGVTPTVYEHTDPQDGPYKFYFSYVFAPEDCTQERDCQFIQSCSQCGCCFLSLFGCAVCLCAKSCEVCGQPRQVCRKRPAKVVFRAYINGRFTPCISEVFTLNNQGRDAPDVKEVTIVRSQGRYDACRL